MIELATYVAFFALAVTVGSRVPLGRPVEFRIAALSPLFGLMLVGVEYATSDPGLRVHDYATRIRTLFWMATIGGFVSNSYLAGPAAEYMRIGPDKPPGTNMIGAVVGPAAVVLMAGSVGSAIAMIPAAGGVVAVLALMTAGAAGFFLERELLGVFYGATQRRLALVRAVQAAVLAALTLYAVFMVFFVGE